MDKRNCTWRSKSSNKTKIHLSHISRNHFKHKSIVNETSKAVQTIIQKTAIPMLLKYNSVSRSQAKKVVLLLIKLPIDWSQMELNSNLHLRINKAIFRNKIQMIFGSKFSTKKGNISESSVIPQNQTRSKIKVRIHLKTITLSRSSFLTTTGQ